MGIEWYRFRSVRMAIEVSRVKKADISRVDVRQSREGSHWSPLAEGDRMVSVS